MATEELAGLNVGKVLIRPDSSNEKTAGGLYVPVNAQDREQFGRGVVVLCGLPRLDQGGRATSLVWEKGDHVLYSRAGSDRLKMNGEELVLARIEEVVGVLKE